MESVRGLTVSVYSGVICMNIWLIFRKVPGGVKARKGYFFGLPEDSPTGYLMYDINAAVVRTVYSATFDESFRRRLAGIKVYDTAREMYGCS